MRRYIYSIITIVFTTIMLLCSCSNENKGYREYYHPMGNNPVQVVPWLKSIKKSFHGNKARISLYELDSVKYYTAQLFIETGDLPSSPFTIYETDDERAITYFHTDDALASEQDDKYVYFIENADQIRVLWSNEKKRMSFE